MECRFCRNEIPEGTNYCPYCGGSQYGGEEAPQQEAGETQLLSQEEGGTQLLTPDMEYYGYGQEESPVRPDTAEKKRKKWPFILIGAVLLAVIVTGIIVFLSLSKRGSKLFYLKDNSLYMAELSERKPQGSCIKEKYYADRDDATGYMSGKICRSEDGKYLFYPSDYEDNVYTLYYSNLKKNKEEPVKVDSGVVSYYVTSQNKVVYRKENGALYLYDMKEKTKIAGEISRYWVAQDGSDVMWTVQAETDTYDLYYQELSMKKPKEKVDSYVSGTIICSDNLEHIAYIKNENLYAVNNWGDKVKIASDVSAETVFADNGDNLWMYYLKEESALLADELIKDDVQSELSETYMKEFDEQECYMTYTLFCYDLLNASNAQVDTDVMGFSYIGSIGISNVVSYNKLVRDEIDRVNLSETYSYWDNTIWQNIEAAQENYIAYGNDSIRFEVEQSRIVSVRWDIEQECIYYLAYEDDERLEAALYRLDCSLKNFGDNSVVAYDVDVLLNVYNGKVYYLCDCSGDSGDLYCDGEMIAGDVYNCIGIKDSDSLLLLTDMSRDSAGYVMSYTLRLYKDDKSIRIADDAYDFVALADDEIAALVDYNNSRHRGDLIVFDGKKTTVIDTDVTAIYGR